MQIILLIFFTLMYLGLHGQSKRYDDAMKEGKAAMEKQVPDYDKAIISFQSAQIAANETNFATDEPAKQLKKVFDALKERLKKALSDEKRAKKEEEKSIKLRELAKAQAFANAAYIFSEKDPTIAVGFALESLGIHKNNTALISLLKAFNINSWFYSTSWKNPRDMDISPDGRKLANVYDNGGMEIVDLATNAKKTLPGKSSNISFLQNGNILTWEPWNGPGTKGTITIWNAAGEKKKEHQLEFIKPTISKDGSVVVPAFDNHTVRLYKINGLDGSMEKELLPTSLSGLDLIVASENNSFAIINNFNSSIYLKAGEKPGTFISHEGYVASDVDIRNGKLVFSLKGMGNQLVNAVGVLDTRLGDTALTIVPCRMTKGTYSGSMIRFLDSNRIIVSTIGGISEIVDLISGESDLIPGRRAPDEVIPFTSDSLFLLARRSGEIAIYNYRGKLVSNLLGNVGSDGHNPAFYKVAVTADGKQVLTVSRAEARLWHRPQHILTAQQSKNMKVDSVALTITKYFESRQSQTGFDEKAIVPKDIINTLFVDNLGQILLQFNMQQQSDMFKTGLMEDVDRVFMSKWIRSYGFGVFSTDGWQRLFVLDPGIIYSIVSNEVKSGRLKTIDRPTRKKWVETDELTEKIEMLKLNPIK